MHETIRNLIRNHDICVLATASDNQPHTSLMSYLSSEDCRTLYLLSSRSSKKYANCLRNPRVSVLIDTRTEDGENREAACALTIEASCVFDLPAAERTRLKTEMARRLPHLSSLAAHPDSDILTLKARTFLLLEGVERAHFEVA